MTDLVDQMFPPVHRNVTAEFTDFNYWRAPMQEFELPDLTPEPVSPALSARSDTSRLSRLRNFSLVTRSRSNSLNDKNKGASGAPTGNNNDAGARNPNPNPMVQPRQKERQSSPLASPVLRPNDDDDDDDEYDDEPAAQTRKRDRRLSMPGSIDGRMLEDEGFGEHDPDLEEAVDDEDDEDSERDDDLEDPDATFDDDILATGEMADIPFL